GVEPTEERALQALVADLLALMDEAPLAVDADPGAAQLLQIRRVWSHTRPALQLARRTPAESCARRSLARSFSFLSWLLSICSSGVSERCRSSSDSLFSIASCLAFNRATSIPTT